MTNINYIQFHIGDFLGGVIGFDAAETGAYMMLLCAHYQAGEDGLPDDDDYLARIAKVGTKAWKKIRPRIEKKFTLRNGFWTSERVVQEILRVKQVSSRNSSKSLRRHRPDDAAAEPRQCKPITNNQEEKKEPPKAPHGGRIEIPDWLPAEAWENFKKHRGKKFTAAAQLLAIGKLERWMQQGHDPAEIIETSIMNGWQGLFEPKGGKNGNGNRNSAEANLIAGFGQAYRGQP